jgi:hypothetical protein
LTYPVLLVVIALGVGFRRGGDMGDLAASFLSALLFLVACPTAWVFAFDFIEVTRFTVIGVGVLTSFPLWYALSAALAERADFWGEWLRWYVTACLIWTVLTILLMAVIAQVA